MDDRKHVAAYCVFFGNTLVSWSSKKQTIVVRSSTEKISCFGSHTHTEVVWLKQPLSELGMSSIPTPIMWCDNISVGTLASNRVFYACTKILKLMCITFETKCFAGLSKFVMFHQQISWLTLSHQTSHTYLVWLSS